MDLSRYYRTNVKKSIDEDRAVIIAGFQDIIKRGLRVSFKLVNYYKGLPLSYPATIVEMDRGTLEVDVHKQQAVVMEKNNYTFIKCDYFDSPIMAKAQSVNVAGMMASLHTFSFVQIMAESRNSLRLELEPQTETVLKWQGTSVAAKVIEISLGGFSARAMERCQIPIGEEISLKLMVPNLLQNTVSPLTATAKLMAITDEDGWDICRFCLTPDAQAEALLSRYIFQRQVEIIRELKELA
jgi:hypothetical protein